MTKTSNEIASRHGAIARACTSGRVACKASDIVRCLLTPGISVILTDSTPCTGAWKGRLIAQQCQTTHPTLDRYLSSFTSTHNLIIFAFAEDTLPWEPTTFIFRGYDPYLGGLKPSLFMVLGSKGSH